MQKKICLTFSNRITHSHKNTKQLKLKTNNKKWVKIAMKTMAMVSQQCWCSGSSSRSTGSLIAILVDVKRLCSLLSCVCRMRMRCAIICCDWESNRHVRSTTIQVRHIVMPVVVLDLIFICWPNTLQWQATSSTIRAPIIQFCIHSISTGMGPS